MANVTYFVALPTAVNHEGDFVAQDAEELQSAVGARRRAEALAAKHGGAVAFSRTGDPTTGEFEDAVLLARYGVTPDDLSELLARG